MFTLCLPFRLFVCCNPPPEASGGSRLNFMSCPVPLWEVAAGIALWWFEAMGGRVLGGRCRYLTPDGFSSQYGVGIYCFISDRLCDARAHMIRKK
jgi:hypothetical protein